MAEKPFIPSPNRIRIQQQIIIQSFGLANVLTESALLATVPAQQSPRPAINNLSGRIPAVTQDTPLPGKTPLGTPVWTNLKITGDSYVDPVTNQTITIPGHTFYSILITLAIKKKIIKTDIQGRNGTIKEYIATDDIAINIKGGVFGLNNQRPKDEIAALKAIFKVPNISLQVQAPIFDEWDITNMVVEEMDIPETMGGYSYQLFEVKSISDQDLILNLSGL